MQKGYPKLTRAFTTSTWKSRFEEDKVGIRLTQSHLQSVDKPLGGTLREFGHLQCLPLSNNTALLCGEHCQDNPGYCMLVTTDSDDGHVTGEMTTTGPGLNYTIPQTCVVSGGYLYRNEFHQKRTERVPVDSIFSHLEHPPQETRRYLNSLPFERVCDYPLGKDIPRVWFDQMFELNGSLYRFGYPCDTGNKTSRFARLWRLDIRNICEGGGLDKWQYTGLRVSSLVGEPLLVAKQGEVAYIFRQKGTRMNMYRLSFPGGVRTLSKGPRTPVQFRWVFPLGARHLVGYHCAATEEAFHSDRVTPSSSVTVYLHDTVSGEWYRHFRVSHEYPCFLHSVSPLSLSPSVPYVRHVLQFRVTEATCHVTVIEYDTDLLVFR
ncbi:hypothetical protein KIPB_009529 [Kipferlia bialata]|uniref:Uncharacterized protein n=1 Tax=Kipferlia bialata TaxID=797122 RepID=A0A9K3D555_9EUKA|nr:hypothetical protein KIPB_009529 [Kipferlia bialata]|eukprot:g9529.t1